MNSWSRIGRKNATALGAFLSPPNREAMLIFHEGRTTTEVGLSPKDRNTSRERVIYLPAIRGESVLRRGLQDFRCWAAIHCVGV